MRKMSASVDQRNEGPAPAAFPTSDDALSELGDGSSSLSDIEDKEGEPDDLEAAESENEIESDPNDSEAETERLENSPHNQRKQKDIVMSSQAESRTYEQTPSKLQHQYQAEAGDDDDHEMEDLSDDEVSLDKSPKSLGPDDTEQDPLTAPTSLEDSSGEGKGLKVVQDTVSKKRKRSLLPDRGVIDAIDPDEPARKRTGSVGAPNNEYAIDDAVSINGEGETSNPISGNISDAESIDPQEEEDEENHEHMIEENGVEETATEANGLIEAFTSGSKPKKGRKKRRSPGNITEDIDAGQAEDGLVEPEFNRTINETADVEEPEDVPDGDEAEAAAKNEEEQERKRVAMDQLGDIERHFASFRDRLYEERLAQLEIEEAMLKQDKPTHPEFLAMLQCVDARRDERLRIEARWTELQLETIQKAAVAGRSQIMAQFYQEVRDIRESKLELLGKQWYEIQHGRRGYGSNAEDYAIRFPTRKSQQVMHQLAYNAEVSVLSGVAKYVGFPAAPPMAPATTAEVEHDLEKMNRSHAKKQNQRMQQGLLLPELAALRAATSTTGFKPAEEQFIEQTPWANPQHPSHAHVLQQALGQQPARLSSPFSIVPGAQVRRPSHQHPTGTPISGTFSESMHSTQPQVNGAHMSGGQISPVNPFANSSLSHKSAPSPLDNRQTPVSPQQAKPHPTQPDHLHRQENLPGYSAGGATSHSMASMSESQGMRSDFPGEAGGRVERSQPISVNGRF